MTTYNRSRLRKIAYVCVSLSVFLAVLTSCGSQSTTSASKAPITIGVSLSLTGDFSSDGKATEQGYQLWADTVNANGGLLGRQVKLDILSDASSPQQVVTNYQKLINIDHVDLTFGPYSTLLTKPSSVVANRYGYAIPEGSGGGPSVFTQGLNNVFDVTLPVANDLISFAQYILAMPAASRPKTAAYATEDDPFTQPQVDTVRAMLEKGGVKTVYTTVYPAETTDFTPIADKVIQSGAQIDVFGTMLPDIISFMQTFKQQHYNPQALIATAGPDQGSQFSKAVGLSSTEGVLVPNTWYPQGNYYQNATMVKNYLAKYGGTAADMSADTAEAYSVGQVVQQAITKDQTLNNAALIKELHSGTIFNTVQGPVQFNAQGENVAGQAYLFQWQKGSLAPVYPAAVAKATFEYPKPQWAS